MKARARHLSFLLSFVLLFNLLVLPATAANTPTQITPDTLVQVVADQTGLPRNMTSLVNAGYITKAEQIFFTNHNNVTFVIAWRILLPAFGLYPYPAEIYPDITPSSEYPSGVYADARAAAIKCGIAVSDDRLNQPITVNEFNILLQLLRYGNLSLPTYTGGCAQLKEIRSWNLDSARSRNSIALAYKYIPAVWREDFDEQGWQLELDPPDQILSSNGSWIDMTAISGLTHYQNRTLYIMSDRPSTTAHEFTHYAAKRAGYTERFLNYYFNREASSLAWLLGSYSQTNSVEYLAEFGACWLLHPEHHTTMRNAAPQTASIFTDLIYNYNDLSGRDSENIIYYNYDGYDY